MNSESDDGASESSEDGDSSEEEEEGAVSSDMDVCDDQQGWQREKLYTVKDNSSLYLLPARHAVQAACSVHPTFFHSLIILSLFLSLSLSLSQSLSLSHTLKHFSC